LQAKQNKKGMTRRKFYKALKRLKYIPGGRNLFKYCWNKISHYARNILVSKHIVHPATVMVELTNHCNLHCITCAREYEFGKQMALGHIDFDLFKSIVDQVYPYIDSIGLTGLGEPLMYKHLPESLAYIKSKNKGIITSISTNANLPQAPQIIGKIKNHIDTIQVSIDGIGEVYNQIRKNGDFDKLRNNLIEIVKITENTQIDIMFNMVVMKENYFQMADILEFANEIGVGFVNFTLFNLASVTNIPIQYYEFYQSDEFKTEFRRAETEAAKYTHIEFTTWDYRTKSGFRKCNFPWTHFYFTWDGFLAPCCAKPFPKELNFGNLNNKSLMDCINSDGFKQFRQMWLENKTPDFCKKCHFIDLKEFEI
jgi:radical SAM protein with 4Fe4S-binding SPASM domain